MLDAHATPYPVRMTKRRFFRLQMLANVICAIGLCGLARRVHVPTVSCRASVFNLYQSIGH